MTILCDDVKFENDLDRLAYFYGSDKCPQIKHHYTPYYYNLFKGRCNSIKKVFEMGVGHISNMNNYPGYKNGASLYMWQDFFPKARIYGADIMPELVFKEDRIETFYCDQSSKKDLVNIIDKVGSDIDIFIDDGSHIPEDQMFTCLTLMPMLDKDVTYIIEDVGRVGIINSLRQYDCEVIRFAKRASRDDRLIVVKNKYG